MLQYVVKRIFSTIPVLLGILLLLFLMLRMLPGDPAMIFKDGRFLMSFGVMGGDMQPWGHDTMMPSPAINQVGGGQAIYLNRAQNVLLGASDRRKDGCVIGY